jgi:hypothetical protein
MKVFTVYFEICGKKMRMNLKANNETEAKKVITDKINRRRLFYIFRR